MLYKKIIPTLAFSALGIIFSSPLFASTSREPEYKRLLLAELEKDPDRALSDQIRTALKESSTLAAASKDVTVASVEGTVILKGFVQSGQDKNDVTVRVRQVPGVLYINDQIQVKTNKY